MREFSTGATRDDDIQKIDPEGFLSPIVLERYCQYLHKHRIQADGKLRASDNWQKTFGDNHFSVCLKSAFRHFMDVWLYHRGYKRNLDIQDSICATIFNLQAYLFKLLDDGRKK